MVTAWTTRYDFDWKPLLTFRDRRAQLAAWIDEHVDVRAVLDVEDDLGVGIGHRSNRLVVTQSGCHITVGAPSSDTAQIDPVVEMMFKILRPRGVRLQGTRSIRTATLQGNYESYVTSLTRRVAGPFTEGFSGSDCAVRIDVDGPVGELKVEFGVVNARELRERITGSQDFGPPLPRASDFGQLPTVSLLGDVSWRVTQRTTRLEDDSPGAVWDYFRQVVEASQAESDQVIADLAEQLEKEGGRDELTRGA